MAKNQCSSTGEGRHQQVLVANCVNATVESGDMVAVGTDGLHGVAFADQVRGTCVIDTAGRWYLPVESGATIVVGDALYVDITNQTLDNDPSHGDGIFFGFALEAVTTAQTGDVICVLVVQEHVQKGEEMIEDEAVTTGKLADGAVTADKLVNGASLAGIVASGIGVSADYDKDTNGVQVFNAAVASGRSAICVVTVTQTFAIGTGTKPTFKIGEVDDDDSFFAVFDVGTAGDVWVSAANVTLNKNIIVTATEAIGDAEGAISVFMLILPSA